MYQLRDYQQRSIDELLNWFRENSAGNPIMAMPTGSGKSLLVAELCRIAIHGFDHVSRVLMLVPSKELAEQNYEKIAATLNDERVGVISASMGRKDFAPDYDVLVATIGTVARMHPGNLGHIGLVIVDEAHLVNPNGAGMYRKLISGLQTVNPDVRVVGLTATPFRGNGVWLHKGKDPLFDEIATDVTLNELIDLGYLSRLVSAKPSTCIKSDGLRIDAKTGDFVIKELAQLIDKNDITDAACKEIVEIGKNRKSWMVFCATIKHATHVKEKLRQLGIKAAMVTGKTPKREREITIEWFKAGHYRCLVNVAALTTGFDAPDVDMIVLLRNTRSPVLYTQIAGRGMRIADGKIDCKWLDFTDSTLMLGPIDQIKGQNPREPGARVDSFRICPECETKMHSGYTVCPECGEEFPREEVTHRKTVQFAPVMSAHKSQIETFSVTDVKYRKHFKRGAPDAPPTLRVDYQCGLRTFSEWVCFDHAGYARRKAESWWMRRSDRQPPESVSDALLYAPFINKPESIVINDSGKYPNILEVSFQ